MEGSIIYGSTLELNGQQFEAGRQADRRSAESITG